MFEVERDKNRNERVFLPGIKIYLSSLSNRYRRIEYVGFTFGNDEKDLYVAIIESERNRVAKTRSNRESRREFINAPR